MDTGNTSLLSVRSRCLSVHPRGYGEHVTVDEESGGVSGSSPWIRGTLHNVQLVGGLNRFIPVDTGNTLLAAPRSKDQPVHPRGYGEHTASQWLYGAAAGSSPWIRGTLRLICFAPCHRRFIPVDTGNTSFVRYFSATLTVHPRGYGEHNF